MHAPARPALILFPRFGGAAAAVEPMGEGEAFVRLTEASKNYTALGEAGFAALTRLVRATPAFALSYPDSAPDMAPVDRMLTSAGRRARSVPSLTCPPGAHTPGRNRAGKRSRVSVSVEAGGREYT